MAKEGRQKILVVGAHPSDPFANVGGTIAKHVKRGDEVALVTLTYGVEVHTDYLIGRPESEIKRTVYEKSMEAAALLGVSDYRFLDFGDTPLMATRDNLIELGEAIQDSQPDVVISAHIPLRETGLGGDHGEAGRMVERAPSWRQHFGKKPHRPKAIYFSITDIATVNHPIYRIPDTFVDITDTIDQKIEACMISWNLPPEDLPRIDNVFRGMGGEHGRSVGVKFAEPFESPWLERRAVDHLE